MSVSLLERAGGSPSEVLSEVLSPAPRGRSGLSLDHLRQSLPVRSLMKYQQPPLPRFSSPHFASFLSSHVMPAYAIMSHRHPDALP